MGLSLRNQRRRQPYLQMCLKGSKEMINLLCSRLFFLKAKSTSLAFRFCEIKNLLNDLDVYGGAGLNEISTYSFNEETFPGGCLFLLIYFS